MAYLFLRAKILKASSGKSAVAAAAYQSAEKLTDESLGMTFQYRHKEEVVFSEILLPANAPAAYADRETLWNEVQKKENKANSQVARQFIIAMPKEWTEKESIERARSFLQENLVNEGMVVDWAFHMKEGNPHLHCLCTLRGFNNNGNWDTREKKAYVLDEHGERVPEIDPDTGEQKVRIRNRNGYTVTEKIWKRMTIQANPWNTRQFLYDLKNSWVKYCNTYLQEEEKIDNRSTHEYESNRVPLLHEGPDARAALERGIVFDVIKENMERRRINDAFARLERLVHEAKKHLDHLKQKLQKWREEFEKTRGNRAIELIGKYGRITRTVSGIDGRDAVSTRTNQSVQQIIEKASELAKRTEHIRKHRH